MQFSPIDDDQVEIGRGNSHVRYGYFDSDVSRSLCYAVSRGDWHGDDLIFLRVGVAAGREMIDRTWNGMIGRELARAGKLGREEPSVRPRRVLCRRQ